MRTPWQGTVMKRLREGEDDSGGREGEQGERRGELRKFCSVGTRAKGRAKRGEEAGKGHPGSMGLRPDVPSL